MNHDIHDDKVLGKAFDLHLTRRLLRFLAPYRGLFCVCVILILIITGIQIGLPYLSKLAIDAYLTLPQAIVSIPEAPSFGSPIPLGDGRYLIDVNKINPETRRAWEAMGILSAKRYLFIPQESKA
ncbi:hypothetical protein KAX17_12450, partial [Candidatus Bipolaricaulota bacterium]|nr:hypothetical protein [Candidatus Bipolaricaulota bacterium]